MALVPPLRSQSETQGTQRAHMADISSFELVMQSRRSSFSTCRSHFKQRPALGYSGMDAWVVQRKRNVGTTAFWFKTPSGCRAWRLQIPNLQARKNTSDLSSKTHDSGFHCLFRHFVQTRSKYHIPCCFVSGRLLGVGFT